MQQSQQWGHANFKAATYSALSAAIARWSLPFYCAPDGMTARIDGRTAFEPDAPRPA
jgi:hypothetical protein